ncbi:unnamed protein product [Euphydryas editha]|uniref:Uncharacterized protein n=1 Tax=Euphydryas editha TaxID=104508 RepID=A0AAU9TY87_EUPED|nr:unnamed protein product [Euphydryas editha]
MSEGGHGGSGTYPARSPMSSSTTGHSSSSHRLVVLTDTWITGRTPTPLAALHRDMEMLY